MSTTKKCHECADATVELYCEVCSVGLCRPCTHPLHTTFPVCMTHVGEPLRLHCSQHEVSICSMCAAEGAHGSCTVQLRVCGVEAWEKQIDSSCDRIQEVIQKVRLESKSIARSLGNSSGAQDIMAFYISCGIGAIGNGVDHLVSELWEPLHTNSGETPGQIAYKIGACYLNGVPPVFSLSDKRAGEWFVKSAALGDPDGMNALGEWIHSQSGDDTRAAELFKKAAWMGHSQALRNLGKCLEEGRGIPRDLDASIECLKAIHPNGI